MAAATSSANTLAMRLFAVATIVFIVGGIGVMNVLFVSVKERTPEIGILKAVGCPAGTILAEFLLEAVFMGVAGGLLGIASSFGLVPLLEMLGMRLEPTLTGYLLAVVFAVVTAGLFGLYPALKASKLVPIEALALNA
jgi:putative ABC transport system permease protein